MFSLQTKFNIAAGYLTKNRPFYVQYYILSRCNLVCRQCNIVEANSDLMDADLKTVEKIAINLKKIGAGVVLLTGGEPFLRKDLPQMVKIFKDNGLNPRMQTAGFATTRKQLEDVREAGASDINISLDSLVEEKQNYINGSMPNSWRNAIKTIVASNEIFDSPDRICAFGTVLSSLNFMEIPAIVEFAEFMGWYESIVPVHITDPNNPMNFRGIASELKFKFPEDKLKLDNLKEELKSLKRSGKPIFDSYSYIDSMFYFLEHDKPNWRKDDVCDSPNLYFAILPNGDFAVCCDHRYQGKLSVASDDFPKVYKSGDFRNNVRKTTTACSGCNYGSYPEVTLSVRDNDAFLSRLKTVVFGNKRVIPKRTEKEAFEFISYLLNEYKIPEYDGPKFAVKPGAFSQRYGASQQVTRGAQKTPTRYLNIVDK